MRRFFLLFIIGTTLALALLFAVIQDPGYVRISIGHWLIESNLWVMVTLNIALILILVFSFKITSKLKSSGQSIGAWFGQSGAQQRADSNTQKGLISFLEGNWEQANKLLSHAANKSSKPLINYLAAAHAANEIGQTKEAESLLKKAYDSTPDSEFAVGIAQAQIQLQLGKYEPCLATLLRLKKHQSNHPFVLKLLKTVYLKLEDWQQLISLLPVLKKVLKTAALELAELENLAWNQLFVQKTDELIHRSQQNSASDTLASLWKTVPDHLRFESNLVKTYAQQLIRLKQEKTCEILLRKILNKHWHDDLIGLYGVIVGQNISEQLITAENWLKGRPNNSTLLLALGRLSLRNELWGKALEYFEASKRLHATCENHAELCRLSLQLKPKTQENLVQFNGLLQAINLPDLPLPKTLLKPLA